MWKGFILQARAAGDSRPVGTFQGNLSPNQTYMWCSGGEPQVTSFWFHFCSPSQWPLSWTLLFALSLLSVSIITMMSNSIILNISHFSFISLLLAEHSDTPTFQTTTDYRLLYAWIYLEITSRERWKYHILVSNNLYLYWRRLEDGSKSFYYCRWTPFCLQKGGHHLWLHTFNFSILSERNSFKPYFLRFRGTFVENYTSFWVGVQSVTVSGPALDPQQPPVIQPGFEVTLSVGCIWLFSKISRMRNLYQTIIPYFDISQARKTEKCDLEPQ